MPFLKPRRMVKHITDLPASFFKERGLRAVILDVDNTLTTTTIPSLPKASRNGSGRCRRRG